MERLLIGKGRTGSKSKRPDPINQAINQPSNLLHEIPKRTKIETRKTNSMHTTDPTHSINNTNDRTVNNNPFLYQMLLSILIHFLDSQ